MNYQNILLVLGITSIVFCFLNGSHNLIQCSLDNPYSFKNTFKAFVLATICFALAAGMRKG